MKATSNTDTFHVLRAVGQKDSVHSLGVCFWSVLIGGGTLTCHSTLSWSHIFLGTTPPPAGESHLRLEEEVISLSRMGRGG